MDKAKYSEYENYILMCDNSRGFKLSYTHFLNFVEAKKFLKQIANVNSDSFTYNGYIYSKKITSSIAQNMLDNIAINNRCDYRTFKSVANQIKVPV
jgi:hypothetical protein